MAELHRHIAEQAFGSLPGATIAYSAQKDALDYLSKTQASAPGLGILYGPAGSGKSTVVRQFVSASGGGRSVALIDGSRQKPKELLSALLAGFGYRPELSGSDELLQLVSVFVGQQARTAGPPLLVVENLDAMYPSALRTLDALAALTVQGRHALGMILTGRRRMERLIDASDMAAIRRRLGDSFDLGPMTLRESMLYLGARLRAAGVRSTDSVFPVDVCDELYERSGGWPGRLNEVARSAILEATVLPVRAASDTVHDIPELVPEDHAEERLEEAPPAVPGPPRVIVSRAGRVLATHEFREPKVLVGRSEFADIVLDDRFASKLHALMLLYRDGLVLLDLNSANGTLVNSVRSNTAILKSDDVVSIGDCRLKIENAPVVDEAKIRRAAMADTARMQSLEDARRRRMGELLRRRRGDGAG